MMVRQAAPHPTYRALPNSYLGTVHTDVDTDTAFFNSTAYYVSMKENDRANKNMYCSLLGDSTVMFGH